LFIVCIILVLDPCSWRFVKVPREDEDWYRTGRDGNQAACTGHQGCFPVSYSGSHFCNSRGMLHQTTKQYSVTCIITIR